MKKFLVLIFILQLTGCLGLPDGVKPVTDFKLNHYLGTWYEIARLDHSFESGLSHVTAEYSFRKGGGIHVLNRGFSTSNQEWKEAIGKAFFVNDASEGYLKVSFFGPFYGSYVVFELDEQNYQYAFISGPNTDYLWLLSRTPQVRPEVMARFLKASTALGFDTEQLIIVQQD